MEREYGNCMKDIMAFLEEAVAAPAIECHICSRSGSVDPGQQYGKLKGSTTAPWTRTSQEELEFMGEEKNGGSEGHVKWIRCQYKGRELRRDVGLYSQVWCQSNSKKSKKPLLGRE